MGRMTAGPLGVSETAKVSPGARAGVCGCEVTHWSRSITGAAVLDVRGRAWEARPNYAGGATV
jgi:hypothetical protein